MTIIQAGLIFALSAPFGLAIWIAVVHRRPALAAPPLMAEATDLDRSPGRFEAETVDLELAVREAAAAVDPAARANWVRIDLAVTAALTVHVNSYALGKALRETMLAAIGAAPGGQVLVTAVTLGSQLHIRVTDDGANADQRSREISTRDAGELIALQGGSIGVEARPGRGTTVTVRLPLPANLGEEISVLEQLPVLISQTA